MHFVIYGAGAVGCYLGGRLAAGGRQVTLVGRPAEVEDLRHKGLLLTDIDGLHAIVPPRALQPCSSLADARLTADSIVLLCGHATAAESAALALESCCPAGTVVVSLLEGVESAARVARIAPRMRLVPGALGCAVVRPGPAHAHRASAGTLYLGRQSLTQECAVLLQACGLPTELADDMLPVLWAQQLQALNQPVNALSGLPLRAQLLEREYRRVLAELQREALDALRRAGIRPARCGPVAPHWMPHLLRLPNWLFALFGARLLRIDAQARAPMWDDLQQGRLSAVDALCGAVVRLAARHGGSAPRNATMCQLIGSYHRGERLSAGALRDPHPSQEPPWPRHPTT